MTPDQVRGAADALSSYATHACGGSWDYSRGMGPVTVRRNDPYDRLPARLRRAFKALLTPGGSTVLANEFRVGRWRMAKIHLRRDHNPPDGRLEDAGLITYWEETGEYLQLVRPTVGTLVAALMTAHPDLPEVQALAAEINRIRDNYEDRIAGWSVA